MRILFATDGSKEAQAAAHLLAILPLGADDHLTLLTVLPDEQPDAGQADGKAEAILAPARDVLCHSPAQIGKAVRRGPAAAEILHAAAEHPTDLLVVGASGHSAVAQFLVGSVAERVARHASCPVLVVRPLAGPLTEVVVGVDDSRESTRAVEWLRQLPLPATEVRLVTVMPLLDAWSRSHVMVTPPLADHFTTLAEHQRKEAQERLNALAASLAPFGKRAVTELKSGDPALGLLQVAEEEGADLIVVGSHGQSAVERFLLGSVSEKVLRHAPCSVLIVKQPAR